MFYEDDKLQNVNNQYYRTNSGANANQPSANNNAQIQPQYQQRVTIEEPKNGFKFEPTLSNISIILNILAIALVLLGRMFAVIGVGIMYQVFFWLGSIALIGALALYFVQILRAKKVVFEPQLIILLVAIVCCCL